MSNEFVDYGTDEPGRRGNPVYRAQVQDQWGRYPGDPEYGVNPQGGQTKREEPRQAAGPDLSGYYSKYGQEKVDSFISNNPGDYHRIDSALASDGGPREQSPSQPSAISSWTYQTQKDPRNDALYNMLLERAQQGLSVDRNNPVIRQQADAYSANERRASRDYMADLAESSGPYSSLRSEGRLASERVGQRTGAFEAQLMGREIEARRNEIAQALAQMGSLLSDDQRIALQRELGLLDIALREKLGMGQLELGRGQLDLGFGNLGLQAENQSSYWDWIRRGGRFN